MIDRELRDEKAVKVAINRLHKGAFEIDTTGDLEEAPLQDAE